MSSMPSSFADLAKRWRGTALTQSAAADALGIDQSALNKIEAGTRVPSAPLLHRMGVVYGLSAENLQEGLASISAARAVGAEASS